MSRLIFFSGGVESTALLCHAGPNDTVITMNHWYPHEVKTYDHTTVEKNAAHFGFRINYVDIKIPTLPGLYGRDHQIASFISVAHLWVAKDKSIKEIWSGRFNDIHRMYLPTVSSSMSSIYLYPISVACIVFNTVPFNCNF